MDTPDETPKNKPNYPPKLRQGGTISKRVTPQTVQSLDVLFAAYNDRMVHDGKGGTRHLNMNEVLELSLELAAKHAPKTVSEPTSQPPKPVTEPTKDPVNEPIQTQKKDFSLWD